MRTRTQKVACLAALVTTLAGCGGGGQNQKSASATGTVTSSATTPSYTPTSPAASTPSAPPKPTAPTKTPAAGQYAAFPGFQPPADLKTVFAPTPSTGNPVKDKILADDVQVLLALNVWSVTGDFKTPGVATYLGTAVYGAYQAQTLQYHAAGKIPAGVTRFYDRRVVALDSRAARVIDCEDGRRNYDEIAKTGRKVPGSSDGLVVITTTYVKNSAGVYQAQFITKEKNAAALCPAP